MSSGSRDLEVLVADLLRHPGSRRDERIAVAVDGLAISTARVPDGAQIDVDVVVEALSSSIVVAGVVRVPWVGECRRCLGEAHGVAEAEVREVFERRPVEGETYPFAGDYVDLEPMVRDAVLLSLPLAPLCAEDCLGPVPDLLPVVAPRADGVGSGAPTPGSRTASGGDQEPGAGNGGGSEDADGSQESEGSEGSVGTTPGDPRWAALDDLHFD